MAVMSPHPVQYATLSYLKLPDDYFEQLSSRYHARVEKLAKALISVGFTVTIPQGAYYLFVDYRSVPKLADMSSMDAALYLLKEVGVASVPGDNFYGKSSDGENHLRFAACRSDSDIEEAAKRLLLLNEGTTTI
jgi:aspartate/methionine/tyrosine aminotransferase